MMPLVSILSTTYAVLTFLKLTQWALLQYQRPSRHGDGLAAKDMYSPSFSVFLHVTSLLLYGGKIPLNKVPRKEFREVSDPWIQAHNRKSESKKPKTFDSLNEAQSDFYCYFAQDSLGLFVPLIRKSATSYVNQPLGLCNVISLLLFMTVAPFLFLRELWLGGGANSLICKIAVATTINDVYVVCCKNKLSFEKALHNYPWVSNVFTRPQIHPMIGRAVCPVYKRHIAMPNIDKMNFEIRVVNNPGGAAVVEQVNLSRLRSLWDHDILPAHFILLALVLYEVYFVGTGFWDMVLSVAPYAAVFFTTRILVDRSLGIKWLDKYRYSP